MSDLIYEVYQGEDRTALPFFIRDSLTNVYMDLSTATEITVNAKHKTSGLVSFTLTGGEISVVGGTDGKFLLDISDTKSDLLKLGEIDLEVVVDTGAHPGGIRRVGRLTKALKVLARLS